MQIYEPGEGEPVAPPDDVLPTDEEGDPLPETPGEDESVVDGQPDPFLPLAGSKATKIYVDV